MMKAIGTLKYWLVALSLLSSWYVAWLFIEDCLEKFSRQEFKIGKLSFSCTSSFRNFSQLIEQCICSLPLLVNVDARNFKFLNIRFSQSLTSATSLSFVNKFLKRWGRQIEHQKLSVDLFAAADDADMLINICWAKLVRNYTNAANRSPRDV